MSGGDLFLDADGQPTIWTYVGEVYESGAAFGRSALRFDLLAVRDALINHRNVVDSTLKRIDTELGA